MKKKLIVLIVMAVLLCGGCQSRPALEGAQPDEPVIKTGEIAAIQGDWIYFINGMASSAAGDFSYGNAIVGALCRVNKNDRTQKDIVIPQIVLTFRIVGEWIYYISPLDKGIIEPTTTGTEPQRNIGALYSRVRVDGTGHRVIRDVTDYTYFGIEADGLYYCNKEEFYYSAHDFGSAVLLADTLIYDMRIKDDKVYYTDAGTSGGQYYPKSLWVVDKDGKNSKQLSNRSYMLAGVAEEFVLCVNYTNGRTETVSRTDGTSDVRVYNAYEDMRLTQDGKKLMLSNGMENTGLAIYDFETRELSYLFNGKALLPREHEGKIYFYNVDDGNRLYVVNVDGSGEAVKYCKHVCATEMAVQIMDGYLYYINADDSNFTYRIDLETGNYQYIAYQKR